MSRRQLVVDATTELIAAPPRLADDLFVVRAAVGDPGHLKAGLASAGAALRRVLMVPRQGAYAVTASLDGSRNFNRYDVEDLIGTLLGGAYHSRRDGSTPPAERSEWRVVLDGKTMWVALRPYDVPLHRRAWRQRTVVGSLHPPVAAAMARLAGLAAGQLVLDPFCGAGTVLLEAHAVQPRAAYLGSDLSSAAITAAQVNSAGTADVRWRVGDAARLSGPVDRILTNPPWDVRIGIGDLTPYQRQWRRVLRPDGLLVAILNHAQAAQLATAPGWRVRGVYDVAVAGRHPRIVVAARRPAR
ncbi:methyltransferase domain-containing protein [Kribbella sp. NPDC005582]|uniref:TRM11 family SAM-dependent methyltransferase n=1 Tax=Kribbella sp. NPDC005582 TaxID=3156893 RepID=UPI0033B8BF09